MRIDRLHLKAFGPFTDRELDLEDGQFGVHVLYGPNEAGKSSALRAVRALLFGVPERTTDTFRHDARALRVGAVVRSSRGEVLTAYRRKGRKDTLLDASGNPQDEKWLAALLQGVDEARFATLFGIDHESLVAGGRSLLAERGREAEALFGSGLGTARVHEVLSGLDQEAQAIFAPRGQKPTLNALLRELDDLRRQARDASLPASRWDEARRARDRARADRDAAELALKQAQGRRADLERLRRTLPAIALLADLEARLGAVGDAPLLAEDFAARRAQASDRLRAGAEALDRAGRRLEDIEGELQGLRVDDAVLDEADAIDGLYARLGEWRRLRQERPDLEAREQLAVATVSRHLALLGDAGAGAVSTSSQPHPESSPELLPEPIPEPVPEPVQEPVQELLLDSSAETSAVASLVPSLVPSLAARLAHRGRAEELARQHEARDARVRDLQERLAVCQRQLARCESELEELPAPARTGPLRDVIRAARSLGDMDEQVAALTRELAGSGRACRDALAALGRFTGKMETLLSAVLPEAVTVAGFQARFQELAGEERRLDEAGREIEKRARESKEELRVLEAAGPVPSPDDLTIARERREQGWQLVKRRWRRDGDGASASAIASFTGAGSDDVSLEHVFESAVVDSDRVADRLRLDAASVHAHAALVARLDACQAEAGGLERERSLAAARRASLEADWRALWSAAGVEPGLVEEMSGWLQGAGRLRDQLRSWNRLGDELDAVVARRAGALQRLLEVRSPGSGGSGEGPAGVVAQASGSATGDVVREDSSAPSAAMPSADAGSPSGESLSAELARVEALLDELEARTRRRRVLEEERGRLDDEREGVATSFERARAELGTWQSSWSALCRDLGLTREPGPGELSTHFDALQAAATQADECASLSARLAENDRHRVAFEADATALCRRVAPALSDQAAEEKVARLHASLREQQKTSTRFQELRRQADAARAERDTAKAQVHGADQVLDTLCQEAGGVAREALEEAERVDQERRAAARERDARRGELIGHGDGFSIEQLTVAAHGVDPATVQVDLEELNRCIDEEFEPARNARAQAFFEAGRDFEELSAGAGAGELEAGVQQVLAGVRDEAAHYLRLRLAALVLREQIDRFRRTHRDPILAAAGAYFRTLTDGGFESVETDFDASDTPVLSAVRDGGERLDVDALSTGTRDQLYLALRLAALDHYLEKAEPLPFIVDDILVQFDDVRTRATLKALASFSARTQVLLFTHHARVAEDAAQMSGEGGGVFVHHLEQG